MNAIVAAIVSALYGSWGFVAVGAAFPVLIAAFWAPMALAGKIRDRREITP